MDSLNIKNYVLNGINYTIDEIKADDQLKKQYIEIIKYDYHKLKTKNRMKELIQDETYKEQVRIRLKKRYEDDIEFRLRHQAKCRENRER